MMEDFKLPPRWIGIVAPPRWWKPYGLCHWKTRMIEVYPVAWIPPWFGLRQFFSRLTWNHEALHAWGYPGCRSPWCLGYEAESKERRAESETSFLFTLRSQLYALRFWEYLAMPLQLLCGLHFCDYCLSWYLAINRKE
jgi:hypothetical protein